MTDTEARHAVKILTWHGRGNEQDFCDHDAVDDAVDCDDNALWAIKKNGVLVGYVCSPHKAAYLASEDRT